MYNHCNTYQCVLQSRASDRVIVNIQLFKCGYFQGKFTWISVFVCLIKVMRAQFGLGHFTIIRQIIFGWIWAGKGEILGIGHCKTHNDWPVIWTFGVGVGACPQYFRWLQPWMGRLIWLDLQNDLSFREMRFRKNIIIITWPFSYCHFIFMHFWKVLICNDEMPCNECIMNLKCISPNSKLTIFHNI